MMVMIRVHGARWTSLTMFTVGLISSLSLPACAGPYVDAVLADNPVGYWRLEDIPSSGGTVSDSSTFNGLQDGTFSTAEVPTAAVGPIRSETE